jgi:type III secretion system low calcium response chaperone LcrH/SycD
MTKTPETNTENIRQAVIAAMNGTPVYEVAGWNEMQVEALHSKAFEQYSNSDYDAALESYKALLILNSSDNRVWLGYGATAMMLRSYEDAIKAYGYASLLDPMDPRAFYHAMESHLALKHRAEALEAARHVLHLAEGKPQFSKFIEKSQAVVAALADTESDQLS